ncbi:MAG: hypothetical protein RLZZ79_512, partial [Actinomycetota bacterium]
MAKGRSGSTLKELPLLLVSALILSMIVKTFFVQFFYIPSGSMENTLLVNDRVGVNKFGAHIVSDGGTRPYRMHFRTPSFSNLQATSAMCEGSL